MVDHNKPSKNIRGLIKNILIMTLIILYSAGIMILYEMPTKTILENIVSIIFFVIVVYALTTVADKETIDEILNTKK